MNRDFLVSIEIHPCNCQLPANRRRSDGEYECICLGIPSSHDLGSSSSPQQVLDPVRSRKHRTLAILSASGAESQQQSKPPTTPPLCPLPLASASITLQPFSFLTPKYWNALYKEPKPHLTAKVGFMKGSDTAEDARSPSVAMNQDILRRAGY
ncbi:uncharacterized protein BO72DRAFT_86327 [Aspergillus fijiensis CBS 313.89]|uniref:Uncharacterized protein n=1 Tax=Aspergillus fijiensis CBS 313.89 TaxID=1448319 RepID=A0A8G1W2Q5_9EURO|nr:uncharacterized protein BO72DRAFT_86327 [Aspergillus fijiensis CBS 313.89]RAK82290.1 hypothetical protein BO72DRAFT_86327 [Aspergillus fijiensis CBS 313.89]